MEWLMWFTQFENTKPLALVIFFTVFCGILFYVFGSRKRGKRLEDYKNIPFQDDDNQDAKGN
ncbi:MAG TPA: cbb3-type cytochrome c oxidase subunit 3 [Methylophilaceae bacterium]|jgi:cbb3-type cytochrome oxidase subunit 3|nr:cbb3-type cytochrome c oxidase subunit 3 [Methylophilaceae bacterium]